MWGLAYCFRGLVHDQHSGEPSDRDRDGAGAVAESFDLIHKWGWGVGRRWIFETSNPTSSNKDTTCSSPKIVHPNRNQVLKHESVGTILIQATPDFSSIQVKICFCKPTQKPTTRRSDNHQSAMAPVSVLIFAKVTLLAVTKYLTTTTFNEGLFQLKVWRNAVCYQGIHGTSSNLSYSIDKRAEKRRLVLFGFLPFSLFI